MYSVFLTTKRSLRTLAAAPLGVLVWFYLYVIRQRILLGYWPRPYHPDPKDAGFAVHHVSLVLAMTLIPGVSLMTLGLIVHRRSVDPRFRWMTALLTALGSFAVYWTVVRLDPGHHVEWFWD